MTKDLDRNIVTVRYNTLNLPDTVQFKNGNQIICSYDASGRRLSIRNFTLTTPIVVPIGETRQWKYDMDVIDETGVFYVDNIEYDFNGCDPGVYMLGKVFNPEGYSTRINSSSIPPDYHYYRKDHLGNNREVWRAANKGYRGTIVPATTVQRMQYYPSGLPWAEGTGRDVQNRKYNGKEFIEMHGYDTYDYVARGMYPAIMRFMTPDPLAEKYYSMSPYAYCANNPIKYIDPTGLAYQTSDPNQLSDLLNHLANGGSLDSFDTNGWNEVDDPEPSSIESSQEDFGSPQTITPWGVGVEWLLGRGPRNRLFTDGDYFTELLKKHEHIEEARRKIIAYLNGGPLYESKQAYKLSGFQGVGKYIKDYSTLLTLGHTGNLAVTYLGSYTLIWYLMSIDTSKGTAVVEFIVKNFSTIESGTRPPVLGYTNIWKNSMGKWLNSMFEDGAMSKTSQTFIWKETLKLK